MYYRINIGILPRVDDFYIIERKRSVAQLVDSNNIIMIVMDGSIDAVFEGKRYGMTAGDVFFVPANHMYSLQLAQESFCTMVYIHFAVAEPLSSYTNAGIKEEIKERYQDMNLQLSTRKKALANASAVYIANMNSGISEQMIEKFSFAVSEFTASKSMMYSMQITSLLISLLVETSLLNITQIMAGGGLTERSSASMKTDRIVRYISEHYSERITLDDLCNCCSLSSAQVIRVCKTIFGMTPMKYITDFRLAKGKEYLYYNPDLTIAEISDKLGFTNQHYFAKLFKERFSETPSEYRKRKLSGDPAADKELLRF